jgi:type II secretory pathway predicted ATPase ExeA
MSAGMATTPRYLRQPFSPTSSIRYFYVTKQASAAIAKTTFVLQRRQGLTLIIGKIGFGKTSLLRYMEDALRDDPEYEVGELNNPDYKTDFALLKAISAQFGVGPKRSNLDQRAALETRLADLFEAGKNSVLLVDEANLLKGDHFEVLRQLLNFEVEQAKLLQIVLAAQPDIHQKLAVPKRKPLVSRITITSTLDEFTFEDMLSMIDHRLHVAGWVGPKLTDDGAVELYERTGGVPRNIVKTCNLAFEMAKLMGVQVTADIIRDATASTLYEPQPSGEWAL